MNSEIRKTIENYVNLIEQGIGSEEENEKELIKLLDELAYYMHYVEYEYDETDYPDEDDKRKEGSRGAAEKRFPQFGHYNQADEVLSNINETKILVGNAHDDVADIYGDLKEVLWRWENNSEADALWCFQDSFGFHWEYHLRHLQNYLYERKTA